MTFCGEILDLLEEEQEVAAYFTDRFGERRYVYHGEEQVPFAIDRAEVQSISVSDDGVLEIEIEEVYL